MTITTRGPISSAPMRAMMSRLNPSMGVKTKKTMARAGIFMVADPCTMAMAPSIPPPLFWKAAETGVMHAEHRFITGPRARPCAVRLNTPPLENPVPLPGGNKKASDRPATRKAKIIPMATSRR